jgi:hypothetical protein
MTEPTILDFKLSKSFDDYRNHMNAPEQQTMFQEMGVCKDDPKRATCIFQGPVAVLYNIFVNPETKLIVEASGDVYNGILMSRWLD